MRPVVFYQFNMGDVEDPQLYCAGPLIDWRKTEYGKWCMEHSTEELSYRIDLDYNTYGYKCVVYGKLTEQDFTFHQLKWLNHVNFNR